MKKAVLLTMSVFLFFSGWENAGASQKTSSIPLVTTIKEKEKSKVKSTKKTRIDQLNSFPEMTVPMNLGMQTKPYCSSTEDIKDIVTIGAKFIRRGFYWFKVEKEKGKYDFTEYDRILQDADDNGIRVLACLYGSNKLYEDDKRGGIQTEEGRKGFANFAAALASHFKERGIIFEIWNEPNLSSTLSKTTLFIVNDLSACGILLAQQILNLQLSFIQ